LSKSNFRALLEHFGIDPKEHNMEDQEYDYKDVLQYNASNSNVDIKGKIKTPLAISKKYRKYNSFSVKGSVRHQENGINTHNVYLDESSSFNDNVCEYNISPDDY